MSFYNIAQVSSYEKFKEILKVNVGKAYPCLGTDFDIVAIANLIDEISNCTFKTKLKVKEILK